MKINKFGLATPWIISFVKGAAKGSVYHSIKIIAFKKRHQPHSRNYKKLDTQACCHYNLGFTESQIKTEETHQPFDHIHHQRI